MTLRRSDCGPAEPEGTGAEWIASYVYPIAGALGIAAYILSQLLK